MSEAVDANFGKARLMDSLRSPTDLPDAPGEPDLPTDAEEELAVDPATLNGTQQAAQSKNTVKKGYGAGNPTAQNAQYNNQLRELKKGERKFNGQSTLDVDVYDAVMDIWDNKQAQKIRSEAAEFADGIFREIFRPDKNAIFTVNEVYNAIFTIANAAKAKIKEKKMEQKPADLMLGSIVVGMGGTKAFEKLPLETRTAIIEYSDQLSGAIAREDGAAVGGVNVRKLNVRAGNNLGKALAQQKNPELSDNEIRTIGNNLYNGKYQVGLKAEAPQATAGKDNYIPVPVPGEDTERTNTKREVKGKYTEREVRNKEQNAEKKGEEKSNMSYQERLAEERSLNNQLQNDLDNGLNPEEAEAVERFLRANGVTGDFTAKEIARELMDNENQRTV